MSFQIAGDEEGKKQQATFKRQQGKVYWQIEKMDGGEDQMLRVKMNWDIPNSVKNLRQDIGSLLLVISLPTK